MLSLYKRGRAGIRYWQAWEFYGTVMVHEGKLGERGKDRILAAAEDQTEKQFIEELAMKTRAKGFAEIPNEEHHQLVVQYRLKSWGAPEDLDEGHRVHDLLNGCLGWTGNGRCTGNDIGSGTLNLFCRVVDPWLGAATIEAELRKRQKIKGAIIAFKEGDEYRVTYPKRYRQRFSLV